MRLIFSIAVIASLSICFGILPDARAGEQPQLMPILQSQLMPISEFRPNSMLMPNSHPLPMPKLIPESRPQPQPMPESGPIVMPLSQPLISGLENAGNLRISTLGHLFVTETGRHRILKFTETGERIDSVGRLGNGDYQFDTPVAIDPTNELKIYVADHSNRRIQVFDRRLQYLSTITLPDRAAHRPTYRPTLLTVDPSGRLYFFDDENHLIYRFNSNGQFDLSFELYSEDERIQPVSMDIRDDELWVIGTRGQLLHRFSSGGSWLGFLYSPEPVRSIRIIGDQLWLLGENNLMRLDHSGEIAYSMTLPAAAPESRRRRGRRSDTSGWRSFDIKDRSVYLLDSARVVKIELEQTVENE